MIPLQSRPLVAEPFEDTCLLYFPGFQSVLGFAHAVTARPWNMVPDRGPQAELALPRRRRVCERLGLPFERLTAAEQIHGGLVLPVRPSDLGAGRDGRHTAIRFIDGMICDLPGVPLVLFSADCPLILAVDPARRVFGAAHASWRGTVARIAAELVRQLTREFGAAPGNLLAGICPCAGPARYEVGDDVRRIALAVLDGAETFFTPTGDRWLFDLRAANVAQLVAAGVPPDRISVAGECTIDDERFFSHRREGPDTGRFALFAGFR
jgi:YfiH family protein